MKRGNIGIFIPHLGCPHQCVFCDQRAVSGSLAAPDADGVRAILKKAIADRAAAHSTVPCEIAFFGGSFTAIDRDYMCSLLDAANEFASFFTGIRISTRPDAIDETVLALLQKKGVTAIELGVQSMDDRVLRLCERGHTAADTVRASALIRSFGIGLGHQMMTGLPGDTPEGSRFTAEQIISLAPDTVRLYPTLVLKNTVLERLWREGKYHPQTVEEAAILCAELTVRFEKANVRVIRVGLHSAGIPDTVVAGPNHPAFGELCESLLYRLAAEEAIQKAPHFSGTLFVPKGECSKMAGQHRSNLLYFEKQLGRALCVREDETLSPRQVRAE